MTRPGDAAAAVRQDVIHDIGYRHYDGQRLGRGYVWQSMFAESAKGAYGVGRAARSKVVPLLCLAAVCVPAVIIGVVASVTGLSELPVEYTAYVLNVQPVVALFVAGQAPATVSRDLRFGVVPLYFSRPMRRLDYVSAKFAAFACAVFVLLAAPLTVLLAGALLSELPVAEQLPGYLTSLAQAVLLAAVLAGFGLLVAAVTPRRGLGVAAIITVLLVLAGAQGIVQAIALEQSADASAAWTRVISPFTLVEGIGSGLLGADSPLPGDPPGTATAAAFVVVALAFVAACWGLLVLRYRRLSVS